MAKKKVKTRQPVDHIKGVWGVLCSMSSVDQQRNNISLFNVIEQFNLPVAFFEQQKKLKKTLVFPLPFEIVVCWRRVLNIGISDEEIVSEIKRVKPIEVWGNAEMMRRLKNSIEKLNDTTSYYSKWLIEKYPFLKINAYDIEDSLLWKHMPKNITFRKKDLQDLHEKEKYDFCLCIDVLNCIPENKIALHNICQSIKKGGYIYIHIPAKKQKRILFKEYFKQYDVTSRKKFPGQLYSKEELVEIVSSFGLTPIKISSTFGLFGNIAWEINAFTGEKSNIFIKITLIPLLILLSFLECAIHNKEGNGMLLLAKK